MAAFLHDDGTAELIISPVTPDEGVGHMEVADVFGMLYRDDATQFTGIDDLLQVLREKKIKITNFATTHISESGKSNSCVIISMRANKKYSAKELIEEISKNDGVVLIERV